MELDGDDYSEKYSLGGLWLDRPAWLVNPAVLTGIAALLVGILLGVLVTAYVVGADRKPLVSSAATRRAPALSSGWAGTPSSSPPAVAAPCRDNLPQFVQTVRRMVDPDGDELHGVDAVSLGRLGKLALKQPSILEEISLAPFQRLRFVEAANQWLCP